MTWLLIVLAAGGFSYSSDFRNATLCHEAETKVVQALVSALARAKSRPTDRDASMTEPDDQKRETARRNRLEKAERQAMASISSTCIQIER
jgi:hypothetical protein